MRYRASSQARPTHRHTTSPVACFQIMKRFVCFILSLAALLPATALAQADQPTLLGRWETRQIGFSVPPTTPDSLLRQLNSPDLSDLNRAMRAGEALLVVNFKADGTYDFTIMRDGSTTRYETGTYTLRGTQLLAAAPGSADGSSFHDQQVQRLTRRDLLLTFPLGPAFPGIDEEVQYRRVGPVPR